MIERLQCVRAWRAGCLALLVAGVAGCGGGGGGGGGGTPEPTLSVARTSLSFDAEQGETAAAQVIAGSLANANVPVSVVIGNTNVGIANVSFVSTGTTTGELTVTPRDPADMAPGVYDDTITVQACLDAACTRQAAGSPQRVAMRYTVRRAAPPPALQASQRGIGFAVVPGGQRTQHSVLVTEGTGTATAWTASSDAAWLAVTATGAVGSRLSLSADAGTLAEGFHLATVTIRASGVAGVRDETLRVGLYKSSAAPALQLAEPLSHALQPPGPAQWVSDPVRPLAYVAIGNTVAAQHFHTGQRTGTLTLPGAIIKALAVSDDGRTLYVLDRANNGLSVVDLETFQVSSRLPASNWLRSDVGTRMAFARVAGRAVLVLNSGYDVTGNQLITPVVDAASGALLGRLRGYNGWDFTHFESASGGVLFAADQGLTGGGLQTARIALFANSLDHISSRVTMSDAATVATTLVDMAVHPDGSRVVLSYFGAAQFRTYAYDGNTLASSGNGPPSPGLSAIEIEYLADGRYVAVSGDRLRLYASDNVQLFEWVKPASGPTLLDGESATLKVSADGLRLMGNDRLLSLPP